MNANKMAKVFYILPKVTKSGHTAYLSRVHLRKTLEKLKAKTWTD